VDSNSQEAKIKAKTEALEGKPTPTGGEWEKIGEAKLDGK
jgi:hypothetical protein